MFKLTIPEAKNILVYDGHFNKDDNEASAEAYAMAARAFEIVESIPDLKDAFPQSPVLDDLIKTMEEKGFNTTLVKNHKEDITKWMTRTS